MVYSTGPDGRMDGWNTRHEGGTGLHQIDRVDTHRQKTIMDEREMLLALSLVERVWDLV